MRIPPILFVAISVNAIAACSSAAPGQQASNDSCHQFALSGGYPYLRGGSIAGPNPSLLELPGAPPQWLSTGGNSGVTAHLDQQDYIERWCRNNLATVSP
jgi:hypothetical protein